MSRFGPLRCYRCGSPIDDKMEAFQYMRSILDQHDESKSHIEKRMLDTNDSKYLDVIFQILKIRPEKVCCRTHFLTCLQPKDLE